MSASSSRPRRYLLGLIGSLLFFFAARWVFLLGKTERLRDLPNQGDFLFDIRQGMAYFQMNEPPPPLVAPLETRSGQIIQANYALPPPLIVRALPVTGGSSRLLGEDRRPGLAFQQMQVTGDSLYYLAYPQEPVPILTASVGPFSSAQGPKQPPALVPASLHRLPLSGGAAVKIASYAAMNATSMFSQGRPICIVGDQLYWIQADPKRHPPHKSASLKVASLGGGASETLLTGISPNTGLRVTQENQPVVWLYMPVETSPTHRSVYRLLPGERKPVLFQKSVESDSGLFQSVFWQGRLYWKRPVRPTSLADYQTPRTEIVSTDPAGSGLRVLATVAEPDSLLGLYEHAGKLYAHIEKEDYRVLMRVDPDTSGTLHEVFRFPQRAQQPYFDGDYLYYAVNEEREDIWNWSQRRRRPVRTTVLYRFRLPR